MVATHFIYLFSLTGTLLVLDPFLWVQNQVIDTQSGALMALRYKISTFQCKMRSQIHEVRVWMTVQTGNQSAKKVNKMIAVMYVIEIYCHTCSISDALYNIFSYTSHMFEISIRLTIRSVKLMNCLLGWPGPDMHNHFVYM